MRGPALVGLLRRDRVGVRSSPGPARCARPTRRSVSTSFCSEAAAQLVFFGTEVGECQTRTVCVLVASGRCGDLALRAWPLALLRGGEPAASPIDDVASSRPSSRCGALLEDSSIRVQSSAISVVVSLRDQETCVAEPGSSLVWPRRTGPSEHSLRRPVPIDPVACSERARRETRGDVGRLDLSSAWPGERRPRPPDRGRRPLRPRRDARRTHGFRLLPPVGRRTWTGRPRSRR